MSKLKPLAFNEAEPEMLALADQVLNDAASHKYYVNRIYRIYNAVTGRNEEPQTCSTCLRNRVREVTKWVTEGKAEAAKASKAAKATETAPKAAKAVTGPAKAEPEADKAPNPEEPVKSAEQKVLEGSENEFEVLAMADGSEMVFYPSEGAKVEDGAKGKVQTADGASVKPGTYKTADGNEIRVQVGGRATYFENFEDLAS